jgi:polysaccharide pyruvyl transferase WcaK-like protein
VLIFSSGGVRNAGDDAILLRSIERVRGCSRSSEIDYITDGIGPLAPIPSARWLAGVGPEGDLGDLLDVHGYDLVVIAGGGYACDWFCTPLFERRVLVAERCRAAGVPVVVSGLGVGPLEDAHTVETVGLLVDAANAVSLRDQRSRALLTKHAVGVERVTVTGDDALGLRPPSNLENSLGRAPFMVVHVRDASYGTDDRSLLSAWMRAVIEAARAESCDVVGISVNDQDHAPEAATLRELAAEIGAPGLRVVETASDPRMIAGVVAGARSVVAHSYHVALFALAAGRPTVLASKGPYYELKAAGLAELAGLSPAVASPVPLTARELHSRLSSVERELIGNDALARASKSVDAWFARQWHTLVG